MNDKIIRWLIASAFWAEHFHSSFEDSLQLKTSHLQDQSLIIPKDAFIYFHNEYSTQHITNRIHLSNKLLLFSSSFHFERKNFNSISIWFNSSDFISSPAHQYHQQNHKHFTEYFVQLCAWSQSMYWTRGCPNLVFSDHHILLRMSWSSPLHLRCAWYFANRLKKTSYTNCCIWGAAIDHLSSCE